MVQTVVRRTEEDQRTARALELENKGTGMKLNLPEGELHIQI